MHKKNKYKYERIIQGYFSPEYGWEDVAAYSSADRANLRRDYAEYKASGQGSYRIISRRTIAA